MPATRRARRASPAGRPAEQPPDRRPVTDPQAPHDMPAGPGTAGEESVEGVDGAISASEAPAATIRPMLTARHRWTFPGSVVVPALLREDGARRGLSWRVLEVFVRRGLLEAGGLEAFLAPAEDGLHDP